MKLTRKRSANAHLIQQEILERRRLLSATLDVGSGLLTVIGTDNDDQIRLSLAAGTLDVFDGQESFTFDNAQVKSILIQALEGNDSARILTDLVRQPATIIGGEGDDTLRGGGGSDSLNGGDGNDALDGGGRGDVIVGGDGSDALDYRKRTAGVVVIEDDLANDGVPGEGDNVQGDIEVIRGGSGDDRFVGNGRSNRFLGHAGNDTLQGAKGNDTLIGGDGDDSLIGNAGDDSMVGEAGSDTFSSDADLDGNDTIRGDLADGTLAPGQDHWDYALRTGDMNIMSRADDETTPDAGEARFGSELDLASRVEIVSTGAGNDIVQAVVRSSVSAVDGGSGDDSITLALRSDQELVLHGGDGNDNLVGYNGDVILPPLFSTGRVQIFGDAGDDYLALNLGTRYSCAREWHGGEGIDTVDMYLLQFGPSRMTLDDQPDDAGGGENIFSDVENLIGFLHTFMQGNDQNNTLIAHGGNCTMLGMGGNDTFINREEFSTTPDSIDGGDGIDSYQEDPNDFVSAETELKYDRSTANAQPGKAVTRGAPAPGSARLVGTELRVNGTTSADTITLWEDGKGVHIVMKGPAFPAQYSISPVKTKFVKRIRITGGTGNDSITLGLGNDAAIARVTRDAVIYGGDGNDTIYGSNARSDGSGGSLLIGGVGNDTLVGGTGADILDGGDQASGLQSDGNDVYDGGTGYDVIDYSARLQAITVSLRAPFTQDQGSAGEADRVRGIEEIRAGLGNDLLTGLAVGRSSIKAGKGNDRCFGSTGIDLITDVGGNDTIDVGGDPSVDLLKIADGDVDTCRLGAEDKEHSNYDLGLDVLNVV